MLLSRMKMMALLLLIPAAYGDFSYTGLRTDEEEKLAREYIHQGYLQRQLEEECSKSQATYDKRNGDEKTIDVNDGYCDPERAAEAAAVLGETTDAIIDKVSWAYSLFMPKLESKELTKTVDGVQQTKNTDYLKVCDKLPTLGTAIGQAIQMGGQLSISAALGAAVQVAAPGGPSLTSSNSGQDDEGKANIRREDVTQRRTFLAAGKTHRVREASAYPQAAAFSATSACYTAQMIQGGVSDPKSWIKMGAAGFLSGFYFKKAKNHAEYAKANNAIAAKFPGKGSCDPIEEPACYCSQPETENDQQYCSGYIAKRKADELKLTQKCINKYGRLDEKCSCLPNNCFDVQFKGFSSDLSFLDGAGREAFRAGMDMLKGKSTFEKARLAALYAGKSVSRLMQKNADKLPAEFKNISLTAKQKRVAKGLAEMGMAAPLARFLASKPNLQGSSQAKKSLFGGLDKSLLAKNQPHQKGRSKTELTYKSGRSHSVDEGADPFNSYMNGFNKKKTVSAQSDSQQELRFAEKAMQQAGINKRSYQNIFQKISALYSRKEKELNSI